MLLAIGCWLSLDLDLDLDLNPESLRSRDSAPLRLDLLDLDFTTVRFND
jgi:hypothetical protein